MRALSFAVFAVLLPLSGCDLLLGADECDSDSDCSGDDVCDSGECVECENDRDCDADEECDDGECERVDEGNEGEGEGEAAEGEGEGEGEGSEGEGEGEGEGFLRGINQACDVGGFNDSGDCESDLVCVPLQTNSSTGVCRLKCGDFDSASPASVTTATPDGTPCPGGTSCQVITTLPDAALAAVACVTRPTQRDDVCASVFDEFFDPLGFPSAACPNGMDCQLTATDTDAGGEQLFTSFNCKEPCDLQGANSCGFGEECLPRSINFPPDLELDIDGTELTCDDGFGAANAACTSGDDVGCPCSLADGYECQVFNLNAGGQGFFCNRDGGNCGVPVPPFLVENEPDFGTDTSLFCNEVEDSRYCDPSVFDGADDPANVGQMICLGASATTNDGICIAFCGSPAFDEDNDGFLGGVNDGVEERFACGAGQACTPELGLLLGIVVDLGRSCSTSLCVDGQPCPDECGPGDAYCSAEGACVAPFFTCEPAPAEGEGEGEGE